MRHRWTPALLVPVLVPVVPMLGFALQGEERRSVMRSARLFASNPFEAARFAYDTIGLFMEAGNFRPVGRFAEKIGLAFAYEAAEATGLALHTVQGVVRMALVAVLAAAAAAAVSAILRSAAGNRHHGGGRGSGGAAARSVLAFYPLALGATLVSSHHNSALTAFPVMLIGSPALVLLTALLVARDRDMQPRRLSLGEPVPLALLGAAAAMTYDLAYTAPLTAAGFIAARATAAGELRRLHRTAAARRCAALTAGFAAAFIPSRIAIVALCRSADCHRARASEVSLWEWTPALTARRLLTGAPPAGWAHTSARVEPYGFETSTLHLAGNWLIAALLAAVAAAAGAATAKALRRRGTPARQARRELYSNDSSPSSSDSSQCTRTPARQARRVAAALAAAGAAAAIPAALLVSLSQYAQSDSWPVGRVWRDSLMVQVGWSFLIAAAVAASAAAASRRPKLRKPAAVLTAAALTGCLAATLLSNARMARIGWGTPTTTTMRHIAVAATNIDDTPAGNALRCRLIGAYTGLYPNPRGWLSGYQLRAELDHLMLDRHGRPFCHGPAHPAHGEPPAEWDRWEWPMGISVARAAS